MDDEKSDSALEIERYKTLKEFDNQSEGMTCEACTQNSYRKVSRQPPYFFKTGNNPRIIPKSFRGSLKGEFSTTLG